jgi:chromosome segregation ATPase
LKTEIETLKDVKARMTKYRTERDTCRAELDVLKTKSTADIEQIKKLTGDVERLNGLLAQATKERNACNSNLLALRTEKDAEIKVLEAQIQKLQADLLAAKEEGSTSGETLMKELEAANSNLRKCESEKSALEAALATEKTRNSALEAELSTYKQQRNELLSNIKALETQLQAAQNALRAAESGNNEVSKLRILIVKLETQLKEEREKNKDVGDLRSKLAAAEQRAAKVPGLEAEVGTLRSKLAAAEQRASRTAELEAQIRQLMEELAATKTQSERVRQLQAEIERLQGQVRGCDTRIADITSRHTNDIQAVLNALKGLMSPIAVQLGEMDQGLGDTRSTIIAIDSLGRSNSLDSLQRNMTSAVQSLTAYLDGVNTNFNKWKELFERTKSVLGKMQQASAYTPAAPAAPAPYTPAAPAAPASTGPKIYILTIKTKRGVYPEKTIKIVAAQKMDSMNYTRATESSIGRELNEENIKRCMNTPSSNFCKMVERGIEQSEFDNIEYIINVIKSYGFQVTKEGPVSQQEADDIKFTRSRQRGGAKYPHGQRDVRYRPDSLKSLAEHQRIWEELKESYDALPEEYKKILPKPGRPPIAHTLEPFTRYIDENAEEDPESIEEARDATDLLGPEEVDEMLESDGDTPAMERVKPYYKKALPNLKEEWLPVMIRADIVSRIINDRMDDITGN